MFNFLGRDFFTALSEKDEAAFKIQLVKYLAGFALGIPVFVIKSYYQVGRDGECKLQVYVQVPDGKQRCAARQRDGLLVSVPSRNLNLHWALPQPPYVQRMELSSSRVRMLLVLLIPAVHHTCLDSPSSATSMQGTVL